MADGQPENGMNGKTRMCGCLVYGFGSVKHVLFIFRLPLNGVAEPFFRSPLSKASNVVFRLPL